MSFLLLCYRMRVYKSKRVPSFTFFGTVRHFPKEKFFFENFKFFSRKNVLRFLSLRYSADLRRSPLVRSYCSGFTVMTHFVVATGGEIFLPTVFHPWPPQFVSWPPQWPTVGLRWEERWPPVGCPGLSAREHRNIKILVTTKH